MLEAWRRSFLRRHQHRNPDQASARRSTSICSRRTRRSAANRLVRERFGGRGPHPDPHRSRAEAGNSVSHQSARSRNCHAVHRAQRCRAGEDRVPGRRATGRRATESIRIRQTEYSVGRTAIRPRSPMTKLAIDHRRTGATAAERHRGDAGAAISAMSSSRDDRPGRRLPRPPGPGPRAGEHRSATGLWAEAALEAECVAIADAMPGIAMRSSISAPISCSRSSWRIPGFSMERGTPASVRGRRGLRPGRRRRGWRARGETIESGYEGARTQPRVRPLAETGSAGRRPTWLGAGSRAGEWPGRRAFGTTTANVAPAPGARGASFGFMMATSRRCSMRLRRSWSRYQGFGLYQRGGQIGAYAT